MMENAETTFNMLDMAVVLVLLVSGVFALRRGFVGEVMALGTWVIAIIFTITFFPLLRPVMEARIENTMLADAATGLALFCLAIIILVPLGDFLVGFVKGPTLSSIDRSLGFVFGLIRGFLIMCLAFMIIQYIWPEKEDQERPDWLVQARSAAPLAYGVEMLKSFVPEDSEEAFMNKLEQTRKEKLEAQENARRLEEMSVPVPAYTGGENRTPPAYEDDTREKMDSFFEGYKP